MKIEDYIRQDTLEWKLYVERNPLRDGLESVEIILDAIIRDAGELLPDKISSGKTERDFSIANVNRLLASRQATGSASFSLWRSTDPQVSYMFSFLGGESPLGLTLRFVAPMAYFA